MRQAIGRCAWCAVLFAAGAGVFCSAEIVEIGVGRVNGVVLDERGGGGQSQWCPGDPASTAVLEEFAARSTPAVVLRLGGSAGFGNELNQIWRGAARDVSKTPPVSDRAPSSNGLAFQSLERSPRRPTFVDA